jgi:hypothetical protein
MFMVFLFGFEVESCFASEFEALPLETGSEVARDFPVRAARFPVSIRCIHQAQNRCPTRVSEKMEIVLVTVPWGRPPASA